MPMDATGQFRHNDESAAFHSKAAGKSMPKEKVDPANAESGDAHELHDHRDGTFHTVHEGEKTEHESLGHALIHMASKHAEPGHSHFHAHHDGMGIKSHSAKSGEEPESRDQDDVEGARGHLDEAMGGEGEMDEKEPEMAGKSEGLKGLY